MTNGRLLSEPHPGLPSARKRATRTASCAPTVHLAPDAANHQVLLTPVELEGFAPGEAQHYVGRAYHDCAQPGSRHRHTDEQHERLTAYPHAPVGQHEEAAAVEGWL